MNILLDTHVFLWLNFKPYKCSQAARALCEDPKNTIFLSIASIWEMQIKYQIGRLSLNISLQHLIESNQSAYHMQLLSIRKSHIFALQDLPAFHNDPFDRIIVSQAIQESFLLVTADKTMRKYAVNIFW